MRQKPTSPADEAFHEAFGRTLKVLRAERGLERKDLAEMAGLSYPYVSEIESGKKRPSSRAVLALAEALGVPAHHLWEVADALQTQGTLAAPAPAERVTPSYFHADSLEAPPEAVVPASIPPPSVAMPTTAKRARLPRLRAKQAPAVGAASQSPPPAEGAGLLDELVAAAEKLPPRDLEQLVELARRLAR